jgi:hypothetical protein
MALITTTDLVIQKVTSVSHGDSENDNPAFRKASVSIGLISGKRISSKLDCQYSIEFKNLSNFLEQLAKTDFVFSQDLLIHNK